MKRYQKNKIAFSILDLILIVLALSCLLSAVFRDSIRSFFGEETKETLRVVFLVENVSEPAHNHPKSGEEIILAQSGVKLGTIIDVREKIREYQNVEDADSVLQLTTLTCVAEINAQETESGFEISGVRIKAGEAMIVETASASFEMLITGVEKKEETV